jgi:hypothetical protein
MKKYKYILYNNYIFFRINNNKMSQEKKVNDSFNRFLQNTNNLKKLTDDQLKELYNAILKEEDKRQEIQYISEDEFNYEMQTIPKIIPTFRKGDGCPVCKSGIDEVG